MAETNVATLIRQFGVGDQLQMAIFDRDETFRVAIRHLHITHNGRLRIEAEWHAVPNEDLRWEVIEDCEYTELPEPHLDELQVLSSSEEGFLHLYYLGGWSRTDLRRTHARAVHPALQDHRTRTPGPSQRDTPTIDGSLARPPGSKTRTLVCLVISRPGFVVFMSS